MINELEKKIYDLKVMKLNKIIFLLGGFTMECEKCRSTNLTELNETVGMETNWCTGEQYEVTTICFKCNDCSFEFTETH